VSYVNQDSAPSVRLHECGMCGNPYPYMCKECNMEIVDAVIQTTAQEMGLSTSPAEDRLPKPEPEQKPKLFVGGGEIIPMWTVEQSQDCAC